MEQNKYKEFTMSNRIEGIDLARALALIGMIIVNFKLILGSEGNVYLHYISASLEGKASALFVFLAGVGIALMSKSALRENDHKRLLQIKNRILKRAIFLFVAGLLFATVWDADILHFYSIYMVITLYFINKKLNYILWGAFGFGVLYLCLFLFLDYDIGWEYDTLEYIGFWTVDGFFRNLLFNGFHPVFAWVIFMLIGLWFGKQDIRDERFLKKILFYNLILFISTHVISKALLLFTNDNNTLVNELRYIFGTESIPPLPLYILNGISISLVIVSFCILLSNKYRNSKVLHALENTGKMALTFYIAHVILGIIPFYLEYAPALGTFPLEFSLIYAAIFSLFSILFANIWLMTEKYGPLELLMRKISR